MDPHWCVNADPDPAFYRRAEPDPDHGQTLPSQKDENIFFVGNVGNKT